VVTLFSFRSQFSFSSYYCACYWLGHLWGLVHAVQCDFFTVWIHCQTRNLYAVKAVMAPKQELPSLVTPQKIVRLNCEGPSSRRDAPTLFGVWSVVGGRTWRVNCQVVATTWRRGAHAARQTRRMPIKTSYGVAAWRHVKHGVTSLSIVANSARGVPASPVRRVDDHTFSVVADWQRVPI